MSRGFCAFSFFEVRGEQMDILQGVSPQTILLKLNDYANYLLFDLQEQRNSDAYIDVLDS